MKPQKYLRRDPRNGVWIYKREFPKDVGSIDGTKTFVRSMETTDLGLANRKWSTVDAAFEAKVTQARSLGAFRASKDKRREKFWLSVARWIENQRQIHGGRLRRLEFGTPTMATMEYPHGHIFIYLQQSFLAWAEYHDPDAAAVFKMGDTRLDQLFECGIVAAYYVAVERQSIDFGQNAEAPGVTGTSLEEVLSRMKQEKTRSIQTWADLLRAIEVFKSACGGEAPTVEATTKEHMAKFRDYLVKQKDWKGRNRNKIRANLSSLYSHAQAIFAIDRNPVEAVATFDQTDSERRKPFTDSDLKLLFGEQFAPSLGPIAYWIPLISLYTGTRQGEIAQLDRSDIDPDPDNGILVMQVTNDGLDQNVKNTLSKRPVPVPQVLIDLGFERFLKTVKSGALFGLRRSPSGGFPNLSKDLNAMIRSCGIYDPLKVFHSFRHTTRTKARTFNIPEEAMDFLSGHAPANVGRSYGTHEIPLLKRLVDQIQYPIQPPIWA